MIEISVLNFIIIICAAFAFGFFIAFVLKVNHDADYLDELHRLYLENHKLEKTNKGLMHSILKTYGIPADELKEIANKFEGKN